MRKKIYSIVTNDEYEFPIAEVCGLKEAIPYFNVKENTLRSMLFKDNWGRKKYKVVDLNIEAEYESPAEYSKRYYAEKSRKEYYHKRWIEKNNGISCESKYGKNIYYEKNGYKVCIKGRYLARFKEIEEAVSFRDEYLKKLTEQ